MCTQATSQALTGLQAAQYSRQVIWPLEHADAAWIGIDIFVGVGFCQGAKFGDDAKDWLAIIPQSKATNATFITHFSFH